MNLEYAKVVIDGCFDEWLDYGDIRVFKEDGVKECLNYCLEDCIGVGDDSPAFYSEHTSIDDIDDTLHYISDRWFCSGRIRFILRVIGE